MKSLTKTFVQRFCVDVLSLLLLLDTLDTPHRFSLACCVIVDVTEMMNPQQHDSSD